MRDRQTEKTEKDRERETEMCSSRRHVRQIPHDINLLKKTNVITRARYSLTAGGGPAVALQSMLGNQVAPYSSLVSKPSKTPRVTLEQHHRCVDAYSVS